MQQMPTAPSKDLGIFERSLMSVAVYIPEAYEVWVVSRASEEIGAAVGRVRRKTGKGRLIDEDSGFFPFNYSWVKKSLEARGGRKEHRKGYAYFVGWYLQQLIKLYCGRAIQKITEKAEPEDVLVVDSDVVFLRPVAMLEKATMNNNKCSGTYRYAFSRENHAAYERTNLELLGPSYGKVALNRNDEPSGSVSGVTHHMVFRADVLADLEAKIFQRHELPLYKALLDPEKGVIEEVRSNAFSEYQLYFHFARNFFPDSIKIRQLYWGNGPSPNALAECGPERWPISSQRRPNYDGEATDIDRKAGYDFVAYHSYAKRRPCVYAPHQLNGVCFGGSCTYSCFKSPTAKAYQNLNRKRLLLSPLNYLLGTDVAPRLCAQPPPS